MAALHDPAVFLGTRSHPTMAQEFPSKQEERGVQSFLHAPGLAFDVMEVGQQLCALTGGAGCSRLAFTLDHSEPI